ncbi:MAG: aminotransferase class IV [Bacteroidota bacterium]|nr:aminotransferase class IV [Bacteroidota bacterium]HHU96088.1 hypothetical protein [Petrimonas sp.]
MQGIEAHQARMRDTALCFGFHAPVLPDLSAQVPIGLKESKKVKCSVVYHEQILSITFTAYRRKKIDSLKLMEADVAYSFKYSDRSVLNTLLQEKGDCDEILIVKNSCITDTSFSNVVFSKDDLFFTPDTYLLNGTKRQQLLREKRIRETRVTVDNLHFFDKVYLINAMLDIEDSVGLSVDKITMR